MAEKTSFSDLLSVEDPLPESCCGNCVHGVRKMNAQIMEELVECQAHPKIPVVMPTPQGPALVYQWPMMRLRERCGDWDLNLEVEMEGVVGV